MPPLIHQQQPLAPQPYIPPPTVPLSLGGIHGGSGSAAATAAATLIAQSLAAAAQHQQQQQAGPSMSQQNNSYPTPPRSAAPGAPTPLLGGPGPSGLGSGPGGSATPPVPLMSASLANNFNALNLNRKEEAAFTAAWAAFMHTLHGEEQRGASASPAAGTLPSQQHHAAPPNPAGVIGPPQPSMNHPNGQQQHGRYPPPSYRK